MKWAAAVHRDATLTAPPKNAAFVLAMHVDRASGACYPGLQRIGSEMGRGANAAKDAVDALVRRGWLDRTRRDGIGTDYRLVMRDAETRGHDGEPLAELPPLPKAPPLVNSPPLPLAELPPPPLVTSTPTPGDFAPGPLVESPPEQGLSGSKQGVAGDDEQGKANRPASVGSAAIGGESIVVRPHALSGGCEPPQGAVPDIAEGDLGEAVGDGVDEPFPTELPDDAEGDQGEAQDGGDDVGETDKDIADDAPVIHHLGDIDISASRLAELEKKFGPSAMKGLLARQGDIVKACEVGAPVAQAVDDALSDYFSPF